MQNKTNEPTVDHQEVLKRIIVMNENKVRHKNMRGALRDRLKPLSYDDIGEEFGVSREIISRVNKRYNKPRV